jgi:hypothetical protein
MSLDLAALRDAARCLSRAVLNPDDPAIRHEAARRQAEADSRVSINNDEGSPPLELTPAEERAFVVSALGDHLLELLDPAVLGGRGFRGVQGAESLSLADRETLNRLGELLSRGKYDYRPGRVRDQFLLALEAVIAGEQLHYVDLDQMAGVVNRRKSTLEKLKRRKKNPLPAADKPGGGRGKKDEWLWSHIRPWLEAEFGKQFTETCARRLFQ